MSSSLIWYPLVPLAHFLFSPIYPMSLPLDSSHFFISFYLIWSLLTSHHLVSSHLLPALSLLSYHFLSWHLFCLHVLSSAVLISYHRVSSQLIASFFSPHLSSSVPVPLFRLCSLLSCFQCPILISSPCISVFHCLFPLMSSPKLSSLHIFHHSFSPCHLTSCISSCLIVSSSGVILFCLLSILFLSLSPHLLLFLCLSVVLFPVSQ